MSKLLSEWTLKEVHEFCKGIHNCDKCRFYKCICEYNDECGFLEMYPSDWKLTDVKTDIVNDEDTNNPNKPARPRLAELLGVEVDEVFTYNRRRFFIDKKGVVRLKDVYPHHLLDGAFVYEMIEQPENIIKSNRLTDAELTICKSMGAKYVSKNADGHSVELWEEKPEIDIHNFYSIPKGDSIASIEDRLFPSVKPKECISVGHF